MKVLVTGTAGFIGCHVARRLLSDGHQVFGLDNLNDYYSVALKRARLELLTSHPDFSQIEADVADRTRMASVFSQGGFDRVVHLAAQAGVRYSIENPQAYIDSNLVGFGNVLEGCRHTKVEHLVYASSSSVYGLNESMPFSTADPTDHPVSLYAATKKANEEMAHAYSHLYRLPTTGLRFFTVYGPWGRPDMAPMLFATAIHEGRPIKVFNEGKMRRDFTYIDDIVEGVVRVVAKTPEPAADFDATAPDPAKSSAPYRVFNIGNSEPVELLRFIELLETHMGKPAEKIMMPMQPGDVLATFADVADFERHVSYRPQIPIEVGTERFVAWFRDCYLAL